MPFMKLGLPFGFSFINQSSKQTNKNKKQFGYSVGKRRSFLWENSFKSLFLRVKNVDQ